MWQRAAQTVHGGGRTAGQRLTVDRHRLRSNVHDVAGDGDNRLEHRLYGARAWAGCEIASCACESGSFRTHTGDNPCAPRRASADRPVQPARRARGEIHVQAQRKDHDKEYAGDRHGDGSQSGRPPARRATADVQAVCWESVKYPGMGVLHDLPRGDAGLRHR